MFLGADYLETHGLPVRPDDYRQVYRGDLEPGTRQASFVDIIGFKALPDFLPEMSPKKTAEQAVTQKTNEQRKELMKRAMQERKKEAVVRL